MRTSTHWAGSVKSNLRNVEGMGISVTTSHSSITKTTSCDEDFNSLGWFSKVKPTQGGGDGNIYDYISLFNHKDNILR